MIQIVTDVQIKNSVKILNGLCSVASEMVSTCRGTINVDSLVMCPHREKRRCFLLLLLLSLRSHVAVVPCVLLYNP